jgi:hypothetical protein
MQRFLVIALAACGGGSSGSGVPRDRTLVTLTDAEITALCEFTVGLGPITGDCGNGEHVTIGKLTVGECIAQHVQRREIFTMCTATVASVEDCTEEFLPYTPQQLCADNIDLPDPCVLLFTSECGGL